MFLYCNMRNLSSLEIFEAVGRQRSFSKAAEGLGLTKSTVSRQIKALEQALGVTLIHRDPRHFALTDQGEVLLKRAEGLLAQVDAAFDEVRSSVAGLSGSIHISTTADMALLYLATPAAIFVINHPEVELNIDLNPNVVDLKSERVDMAIRSGELKDSGLYARKLIDVQSGFFSSPEFMTRNGRPKSILEMMKLPFISTSKIKVETKTVTPSILANNMSVVKQLTLNGAGIGLLPEELVRKEKREGKLLQILNHVQIPNVPIFLVFPDKNLPKRVEALVKNIFETMRTR